MHKSFFKKPRKNKYNAKRTLGYHSKREAKRAHDLEDMEARGEIKNLRKQKRFDFIFNGKKLWSYYADFVYEKDGEQIVEDVKGFRTEIYERNKKMMKAFYNIDILET